jgi:hypothetical protein
MVGRAPSHRHQDKTGRTIPMVGDVISGERRKTERSREYIHLHMNVHKDTGKGEETTDTKNICLFSKVKINLIYVIQILTTDGMGSAKDCQTNQAFSVTNRICAPTNENVQCLCFNSGNQAEARKL